ncbi:hypothetical protein B0T25DRAFT_52416 [Lasiosphaeria hispida]|uniref:Uncharacterized protein n=1 Tax=Lasiosphaeria hispida TaxID=260671 RepID=A0AAJ0HVX2_9PEZI|nr:hypothetical protein B0T25DRAFT_52416 [Lasiosphaeria hispida]
MPKDNNDDDPQYSRKASSLRNSQVTCITTLFTTVTPLSPYATLPPNLSEKTVIFTKLNTKLLTMVLHHGLRTEPGSSSGCCCCCCRRRYCSRSQRRYREGCQGKPPYSPARPMAKVPRCFPIISGMERTTRTWWPRESLLSYPNRGRELTRNTQDYAWGKSYELAALLGADLKEEKEQKEEKVVNGTAAGVGRVVS